MEEQGTFTVIDEHQPLAMAIVFGIDCGVEIIEQHNPIVFHE